ncbi:hypothetical protein [Lewinella sp. W8]|uniref:hypothetical protein n=1 Tax=Lewinella sp. W8 TaxID=2528208 RepID=UPI00106733E0|nr:hypothetical protein [Lewinella sp. W8]MTB49747.1 hypothetical protein [Lewinella sp. W8]
MQDQEYPLNKYRIDLEETYRELKETEWSNKHELPKKMALLSWQADRQYLLYQCRLFMRYQLYPTIFRADKLPLAEEHFEEFKMLLGRRAVQIQSEPMLLAYQKVSTIFSRELNDPTLEDEVEDFFFFMEANVSKITLEDYVDLLGCIGSFATMASNKGVEAMGPISFRAKLMVIDRKYGASWSSGTTNDLPASYLTNVVIQAIRFREEFEWSMVPVDGIENTDESRSVHEWAHRFVGIYGSKVHRNDRGFSLAFCRALLFLDEGKYREAIPHLKTRSKTNQDERKLALKKLTIQTYYDLMHTGQKGDPQAARKLIKNFPAFLKNYDAMINDLELRKQKLAYQFQLHRNFLSVFREMLKLEDYLNDTPESIKRSRHLNAERKRLLAQLAQNGRSSDLWLQEHLRRLN